MATSFDVGSASHNYPGCMSKVKAQKNGLTAGTYLVAHVAARIRRDSAHRRRGVNPFTKKDLVVDAY